MTNPVAMAVGVHVALGLALAGLRAEAPRADDVVVMSIATASALAPSQAGPVQLASTPVGRTRFAPVTGRAKIVAVAVPSVEISQEAELDASDVLLPPDPSLGDLVDFVDFEAAVAKARSTEGVGNRIGASRAAQAEMEIGAMVVEVNRLAVLRYNWGHNPAVSECLNKRFAAHEDVRQATAEFHNTARDARR